MNQDGGTSEIRSAKDRIFTVRDPRLLDRLLTDLPGTGEIPEVEYDYDLRPAKGEFADETTRAACVHCKFPNHWIGFVMAFHDGGRILVGQDCGRKIYGAEFDQRRRAFDREQSRAIKARQIRGLASQVFPALGALWSLGDCAALKEVDRLKRDLRRVLPQLAAKLGAAATSDDRGLAFEIEVEDVMAQVRDKRPDEAEAGGGTKPQPKKMRRDKVRFGPLRGHEIFLSDRSPAERVLELHARLRALWLPERASGLPDPVERLTAGKLGDRQAKELTEETARIIEGAEEVLRMGQALAAFCDRENISRIVKWAKGHPGLDGHFGRSGTGDLLWREDPRDRWTVVRMPRDLALPATGPVELLKRALRGG